MRRLLAQFERATTCVADALSTPWALIAFLVVTLAWAATGPSCRYSDAWQLVINTSTTIANTFLALVLLNSQRRRDEAGQAKLDELIIRIQGPRNELAHLEDRPSEEIDRVREETRG